VALVAIGLALIACADSGGKHRRRQGESEGGAAPSAPEPPSGVTATSGDGQITVGWNSVADADSYNLYWDTAPGLSTATDNRIARITGPFTHAGLSNGTAYYYVVTAVNAGGESAASAEVGATPRVPVPGAPTGVSATAGDGQVTIGWSPVTRATSYNLHWNTRSGVTKNTGNLIPAVSAPFAHTGRVNGTAYYYVVTAVNAGGGSAESAEVHAIPSASAPPPGPAVPPQNPVPAAPTGVTATPLDSRVTIGWNPVTGATRYNLYWSATAGVTKSSGNSVSEVSNPYTHTGRINGTTYYYALTALNSAGESAESAVVSATPLASWTILSPMPTSRELATSSAAGNVIYVIGGIRWVDGVPGSQLATVEAYDVATGTWSTKTSMPTARHAPMSAVINGRIHVLGGHNGTVNVNVVEIYNPATNSWSTGTPMPTPRTAGVAAVVSGILYVIGGTTLGGVEGITSSVIAYDPVSNQWSSKAPLPSARYAMAGGVINGKIYVAGGWSNGELADLLVYDPAVNSWSGASPMPNAREFPAAAVVNDRLYVFGDRTGATEQLPINEAYDAASGTWSSKTKMPSARDRATASALNGLIYVFGGTGAPSAAEAYTPARD
jgi:N-acetylneuraminic acid mutarotase